MTVDPKPRPNLQRYRKVLRDMTAGQRLLKACELSDLTKKLTWAGLRHQYPNAGEEELRARFLSRLQKCHSLNY